ncbi:MAG: hypothetical protein ACR2MD_05575 [Aridibacter sp.]
MKTNSVEIERAATEHNAENNSFKKRFVIFVAGGKRPIISCSNFSRAERLAVKFAGLLNVRMEVFDSVKEICYFIEPFESNGSFVH